MLALGDGYPTLIFVSGAAAAEVSWTNVPKLRQRAINKTEIRRGSFNIKTSAF
jgi:hypothetical protein